MRILIVTTYFEPDQGAASIILTRLAKKLHARGHHVTILTTLPNYPQGRILDDYRGKFQVVEDRDGVRVIQTWLWATSSPKISRKFISQISFAVTALLRGLFIPRPDVMLIVNHPMFASMAGVFLSRVKRVPYVLDVRDLWPDHMLSIGAMTEKHPVYRLFRWLVDISYRWAAGISCASPGWETAIHRYIGPTDKTRVIFQGTDLERFNPNHEGSAFREKYNLAEGQLVTFIGTFATQYDFDTLLALAARLTERPDVWLVFIGGGSQGEVIRQYVHERKSANVKWIPWVDHNEIPLAWAASDVAIWAMRDQPLYQGTIPTKLYEGMASGTPIVAAAQGAAASLIQESGAGFTVPFGDVDGMAAAIKRLLDDADLRRECSQAGRAFAEKHFDAKRAALDYEVVLEKAGR